MSKEANKFDIWSLYNLQSSFIKDIKSHNLNAKLEKNIINWERQKIKILRYNLDSNYIYKIIKNRNMIFIHHLWHGELFDIDQYDMISNHIVYKNSIEYTLGNVFDMVINKAIHKYYNINDKVIFSIITSTYPHARFNYDYFTYISDNCVDVSFKDKVNSRILLYNLTNCSA